MHFLKREQGYTFVEAIFQLVVLSLFAHFIFLIISWFSQVQNLESLQEDLNWELFVLDIREYLEQATEFRVINNGLAIQFNVDGDEGKRTFFIEKSKSYMRKRSLLGGNEIMLTYVESAAFRVKAHELYLKVKMSNGDERERVFIVPKGME